MPGWAVGPLVMLMLMLPQQLAAQASTPGNAAAASSTPAIDIETAAATAATAVRPQVSIPPWVGRQPTTADEVGIRKPRPQKDPTTASVSSASGAASPRPRRFIVQLKTPSAAALVGPTILPAAAGSADDAAATSTTLDPTAAGPNVRADRITPQSAAAAQAIQTSSAAVAAAAGVTAQVTHRYSYALSGFTVEAPTAAQLAALAADPQVASVVEDKRVSIRTFSTPQFLGLPNPPREARGATNKPWPSTGRQRGVWSQLGGVEGHSGAGENVIIGVIDTGLWWDNRTSFADSNYWPAGNSWRQDYRQLSDWRGTCAVGSGTQQCNNKVVGCRYYTAAWGGDAGILDEAPEEDISCRDIAGHGSHTAATAAGNYGATTPSVEAGMAMSGMAPRARLAIYKAMWGKGYGYPSDLAAAVEDAIKDGVDILSYSVGSSVSTFRDPVVMAFMNAARAGIFVAAAASNEGPAPTVEAISPWVMSVAASTHDRRSEADLALGNGQSLTSPQPGQRMTPIGPLRLIYGADVAIGNVTEAALCAPDSLNETAIGGPAIVACDRGTYVIGLKIDEVKRVGGQVFVLMNVPGGNQTVFDLDFQFPYVHMTTAQRETVLAYAKSAGDAATATVEATKHKFGTTAPAMASFSSRGPIPIANAVLMKPDITGPGVSVYAPYTKSFAYLGGTSMSTPHIAGIAALIKDRHPFWSPMAIKSAMMTTAYQTTRTGTTGQPFGTALDYGAGHVDPAKAMNPGLVLHSSHEDWQRFLCDVEPHPGDDCKELCSSAHTGSIVSDVVSSVVLESAGPLVNPQHKPSPPRPSPSPLSPSAPPPAQHHCDASNYNSPSIAGEISGGLTVVRTLTSVLPHSAGRVTFTGQGSADAGSVFDVSVTPASFRIRGKQRQKVTITVKARANTPLDKYQFGQVVWQSSQGHIVRIPISVKFLEFVAPTYIAPNLRFPAFEHRIKIGADAATTVAINNLGAREADITEVRVTEQPDTTTPDFNASGVGKVEFTVAQGTTYFAVALFAEDIDPRADLDLFLYRDGIEIATSGSMTSTEMIEVRDGLQPGKYTVYIYPYGIPGSSILARLHAWMLPATSASSVMQVSPSSVKTTPGDMSCCPITMSFSGLDFAANKRYIGAISYTRADGKPTDMTMVYLL